MEIKFGIYANCSEWGEGFSEYLLDDDDRYWLELEETVKVIVAEKEWD